MLFRLLVLLAVVGAMVLFALQNAAPSLSLVFLGMQTPALPLAWWVLGAIAAGSATTLSISVLFGLSSFVTRRVVRSQVRRDSPPTPRRGQGQPFFRPNAQSPTNRSARNEAAESDAVWQDWRGYEGDRAATPAASTPPRPDRSGSAADRKDDWEQPISEDWDDAPDTPPRSPQETSPRRTDFEARQTPKQGGRSGSAYSYSYRDSAESGAGNPEKVVDADYRVIVPPVRSLDGNPLPPSDNAPQNAANQAANRDVDDAEDWFEDPKS